MPAYWMSRVHVTDLDVYSKYMELAGPAVEKNGGIILARGGRQVTLEGGEFERSVVIQFESVEAAVACYNSLEYQEARQYAEGTAVRHMVAVEGVANPKLK
jgi:uncharacterized protein (DUF1330 family)